MQDTKPLYALILLIYTRKFCITDKMLSEDN